VAPNSSLTKTGTSDKVADLRFDEKKVDGGIGKIKALLDKGTTSTPRSHKLPLRAYGQGGHPRRNSRPLLAKGGVCLAIA